MLGHRPFFCFSGRNEWVGEAVHNSGIVKWWGQRRTPQDCKKEAVSFF